MKRIFASITAFAAIFVFLSPVHGEMRKPDRYVTANGMTILLLERKALPFITVNVTVRAGSVFDPEGLSGLANLTADLLTEGTKNRSASEISEEIDFIGGNLGSSGGIDYSSANLTVLSKDSDKGFELLSHTRQPPISAGGNGQDCEPDQGRYHIQGG